MSMDIHRAPIHMYVSTHHIVVDRLGLRGSHLSFLPHIIIIHHLSMRSSHLVVPHLHTLTSNDILMVNCQQVVSPGTLVAWRSERRFGASRLTVLASVLHDGQYYAITMGFGASGYHSASGIISHTHSRSSSNNHTTHRIIITSSFDSPLVLNLSNSRSNSISRLLQLSTLSCELIHSYRVTRARRLTNTDDI